MVIGAALPGFTAGTSITIHRVKTRYLLFWSIGLLVVILAASAIWFITDPFGFLNAT